ncbi:hypothetical protein D3C75_1139620 [compost metagenome]
MGDIQPRAFPDFGAGYARQHRLHLYAFVPQLAVQCLGETQYVRFAGTVNSIEHLRRQGHHRCQVNNGAATCFAELGGRS